MRVLNEDRVKQGTGFGTHPHREFEIFSYVIDGGLEQYVCFVNRCCALLNGDVARSGDSMGNTEVLRRGDVQMTSAGTGIRHSEKCHGPKEVHFLQIWSTPNESKLKPKYYTRFVPLPFVFPLTALLVSMLVDRTLSFGPFRHFSDDGKRDNWVHIVAPAVKSDNQEVVDKREAAGPAPVHSSLDVFATILSPNASLSHIAQRTKVYAHLIQRSGYNSGAAAGATVKISVDNDTVELREGDGVYVNLSPGAKVDVQNVGEKDGELLLFDTE